MVKGKVGTDHQFNGTLNLHGIGSGQKFPGNMWMWKVPKPLSYIIHCQDYADKRHRFCYGLGIRESKQIEPRELTKLISGVEKEKIQKVKKRSRFNRQRRKEKEKAFGSPAFHQRLLLPFPSYIQLLHPFVSILIRFLVFLKKIQEQHRLTQFRKTKQN
ncbi:hypothetical protein M9H77_04213 [Catharanthus roseus]|uniref:Uncharacterized protein n=1 Tax=Catharanthus roseus TaxID=4058 RepID=A0ACC0CDH6_CATRO|nr:hypothetical protein M9H77_04213 [Catharanthus roseus]